MIDESELLDGDEESTVSPLSTGIQGPGSKLNSMKNLEGIFWFYFVLQSIIRILLLEYITWY